MNYLDFKTAFFNGKTNKRGLIESLKSYSPDFKALIKLIERFERENSQFKNLVKQAFLGSTAQPKSYQELGTERPLYNSNSLEKELNWETVAVIKAKDTINSFLLLKDQFEHELLLGNYENARIHLDKIEKSICISYWSMENRSILDEYQFGTEKNWETRNLYLDDKNATLVQIIGDFYSVKAERKYSFFQFNDYCDGWENLQINSEFGLSPQYRNYLRFKINYFSLRQYENYSDILYTESTSSIVDRYLMLIRIVQHIMLTYSQRGNFLIPLLNRLSESVDDVAIVQLLAVVDPPIKVMIGGQILNIIDQYTVGNYAGSQALSKTHLKYESSTVIELYEIYAKSLVEQNLPFLPITDNESIANLIAKSYYDIYSKNENVDNAFIDLIKLAYVFNNSGIGVHFYSMAAEQLNWKTEIDYGLLKRLNSKFINPALYNYVYENPAVTEKYLNGISTVYGNTPTVALFKLLQHNYENETVKSFSGVPAIKAKLYECRSLLSKNLFLEAIGIYNSLLKESSLSAVAFYEIYSNLFYAYLRLQDYKNCLIIFVDAYLMNPHFIKRMDANDLLEIILKGKFKNIGINSTLIELPIFFRVNSGEKIRTKQAYELFLKANQCTTPSEFLTFEDDFSAPKIIYFLRNVCIPDIMQLSKYMESTYSVNEERIRICQKLALIDIENRKLYNQEIAVITQKNAISKVIGRIDEGKIYVNDEKIKAIFLKSEIKAEVSKLNTSNSDGYLTKEYFYRTVDLQKFTEHREYKQSNKVLYADYDHEGNMKFKNNPVYDSFRSMFLEVRDNFVSNNEFGLDAYLSTRIRHGTLPNHIRSVFELLNLVTAQTDGIYGNNDYWQERLNLSDERNEKIQNLLAEFSRQIDELSTVLKEDWIQSKTELRPEKPLALFDYSYKNDYDLLALYISKVDRYEDFIDMCFDELWVRTELCLDNIKMKLHHEVKENFVTLITDLEQELELISNHNDLYELKNNVTLSRTEIQILLSNIIKWFKRSESSYDGEYELKMLAETSIQITKNINPAYKFEIASDITTTTAVKGEYHQHIIYIVRNFLENMIKRSNLPIEQLDPAIHIFENNGRLCFTFANNIAESVDKPELRNKLQQVKENWTRSDSNISQEDGTGFPKIKKLLHYDLDRRFSEFDFVLIGDNRLSLSLSFESFGLIYENINN